MSKPFLRILFISFGIFIVGKIQSCQNREHLVDCFPLSFIHVDIHLDLPIYHKIRNIGGWMNITQSESGTQGLIVVRTSSGFLAFDRNAPHICPSDNTILQVKNNIKIVCPADGAEWMLLTGEPIKGTNRPLKQYPTQLNSSGNILSIYNQ